MTGKKKIGIYGGTFNPPHIGHVSSARAFLEKMELDELLIIPTATPPHKLYKSSVSEHDRLEMCKIAFSGIERATVSDLEIRRGGKSYTYLTLEELYSEESELYFLCGTDMILSLDTWRKPERIFELSTICFVRREEDRSLDTILERKLSEYEEAYGKRPIAIKSEVIEISSEELRLALSLSEKKPYFLGEDVFRYIKERGLYL